MRNRFALSIVLALAASGAWSGTAAASIANAPGYLHLQARKAKTCIDAQYAPAGTRLVMWRCVNTAFEEWHQTVVPIPGNRFEHCACTTVSMFTDRAMGMCMAVEDGLGVSGAPVVQQDCDPADERQWWLLPDHCNSYGEPIVSFISKKVLDVDNSSSANGVPLQIWTGYGNANQGWDSPSDCQH